MRKQAQRMGVIGQNHGQLVTDLELETRIFWLHKPHLPTNLTVRDVKHAVKHQGLNRYERTLMMSDRITFRKASSSSQRPLNFNKAHTNTVPVTPLGNGGGTNFKYTHTNLDE